MHKNATQLLSEVMDIAKEADVYDRYKTELLTSVEELDQAYSKGKLKYLEYEKKLNSLLNNKTKNEWVQYYNAYIYSLLKKIEVILSETFDLVYDDKSYKLSVVEPSHSIIPAVMKPKKKEVEVFNIDNELKRLENILETGQITQEQVKFVEPKIQVKITSLGKIKEEIENAERTREQKEKAAPAPVPASTSTPVLDTSIKKPSKKHFKMPRLHLPLAWLVKELRFLASATTNSVRSLGNLKSKKKTEHKIGLILGEDYRFKPVKDKKKILPFSEIFNKGKEIAKSKSKIKELMPLKELNFFFKIKGKFLRKKEDSFIEEIISMEKTAKQMESFESPTKSAGIAFGWLSPGRLMSEFTNHFKKKQEPLLGEQTAVPIHMKKLRHMRKKLYEEEKLSGFDSTLLAQEAKRVKRILEVEKAEVYKAALSV